MSLDKGLLMGDPFITFTDGLMKAKIARINGTEETSAFVQVRSGGTMISLTVV